MAKLQFSTKQERDAHPQARLIPDSLWNDIDYFNKELDDRLLSFMQSPHDQLVKDFSTLSTLQGRKSEWLAIAISHPELSHDELHQLSRGLKILKEQEFLLACSLGNLSFIKQLNPVFASHNRALENAAVNGHLEVLRYLIEQHAPNYLLRIIVLPYAPDFSRAISNGHFEVLKYLEEKLGKEVFQQMIKRIGGDALYDAASNDRLDVLRYLEGKVSEEVFQEMIEGFNFAAFRGAAQNRAFEVLNYLEGKLSIEKIQLMIAALDDFIPNQDPEFKIAHYLFKFNSYLGEAEERGRKVVRLYIDDLLKTLSSEKKQYEKLHPNLLFDVSKEQATRYFYCLRHLIRRNTADVKGDLVLLLAIPAVKALIHTVVTPNRPNELFKLAQELKNKEAKELLLAIPTQEHLKFLAMLQGLEQKQQKYLNGCPAASQQAQVLLSALKEKAAAFYSISNINKDEAGLNNFKASCIEIVHKNSSVLQEHRGFLGAVFAAIHQFFVALKASLFNESGNHRFFDSRSDGAKVLDKLEDTLQTLKLH